MTSLTIDNYNKSKNFSIIQSLNIDIKKTLGIEISLIFPNIWTDIKDSYEYIIF